MTSSFSVRRRSSLAAGSVLSVLLVSLVVSCRTVEDVPDAGARDAGQDAGQEDVGDECLTPSVCGGRQYCNPARTCLCIKSAEGVNHCGAIPSCSTQHCQTSADCANLGQGYFCDSPDSGCCGVGSGLCIPSCTDSPCPPGRSCGNGCCDETSQCIAGACCPGAQVCGSTCCAQGKTCVGGVCTAPAACAGDGPTEASLKAALDALATGATSVPLSPRGCFTYSRTLAPGGVDGGEVDLGARLLTEMFLVNGKVEARFTHTDAGSSGEQDQDLDGFYEWQGTSTSDAGTGELDSRVEIRHLDPQTSTVVRREVRTLTESTVHVVIEEDGALANEFDTDVEQTQNGGPTLPDGHACDVDHATRYADYMVKCLARWTSCLTNHGRSDLAKQLMKVSTKSVLRCVEAPSDYPIASNAGWRSFGRYISIKLNTTRMDAASENVQIDTLCHELMHSTSLGGHDPTLEGSSRQGEADPILACESLCGFNFGQAPTKCQCATCTGQDVCNPACQNKGYKDCAPDLGAICFCPKRHQWYPSDSVCRAECPSGLACFGYSRCLNLDKSCK